MKKMLLLLVAVVMMQANYAGATSYFDVTFNGSDIIAEATGINSETTPVIGDGNVQFSDGTQIATYQRTDTSGDTIDISESSFNTWINDLSNGEGISSFNLWLQDGASDQARLWGEDIAFTDTYSTDISTFTSSGWTASVYTIGDEWGSWWEGRNLITYTANSDSDYLRPGTTANFGFTADMIGWDESNGWDPSNDASGSNRQIWVGAGADGIVSDDNADYFQRAISVNSAPVPEPTTWLLFGTGLLGLLGFGRKKLLKKT